MKTIMLEPGSRDNARALIQAAQAAVLAAATEIAKLKAHSPKRVEYRTSDIYLSQAMCNIELARIDMRKRKKAEPKPKGVDAPMKG